MAMAAAIPFGTQGLLLAVLTAAAILFYDAAGKHVPAVGLLLAGLIHASHMMIANVDLAFTFPVWVIFTHTVVVATIVYRFEQKRPILRTRTIVAVALGWAAWSAIILGLGASQGQRCRVHSRLLRRPNLRHPLTCSGGICRGGNSKSASCSSSHRSREAQAIRLDVAEHLRCGVARWPRTLGRGGSAWAYSLWLVLPS